MTIRTPMEKMMINGQMLLMMRLRSVCVTLDTTYITMPTGGEMPPRTSDMMQTVAKWIGSKPYTEISGAKNGTSMSSIAVDSMNMPAMKMITNMSRRMICPLFVTLPMKFPTTVPIS